MQLYKLRFWTPQGDVGPNAAQTKDEALASVIASAQQGVVVSTNDAGGYTCYPWHAVTRATLTPIQVEAERDAAGKQ